MRRFERSERFEQSQGKVALRRVLPGNLCDLWPSTGMLTRPVREQQCTAALVSGQGPGEQQGRGEACACHELKCARRHDRPQRCAAGVGPFDEETLLLTPEGTLGAVRANRHQSEERVEEKTA